MKLLIKSFLLLSLLSSTGLSSLWAKTNDTLDIFYNKTWECAWEPCQTPYYNGDDICFPCDDIILARLELFNYWFSPHAFSNRFQETLLDLETQIETKNIEIHELKLKQKTTRKRLLIFTISGIIGGFVGGVILFK